MRAARGFAFVLALSACSPPPAVQAVDHWLTAYAKGDVDTVVANTWSGDRALVRSALVELETVPTGTLATSLPPRPLKHELLEVEAKTADGTRWTVLTKVTMKNPLPFMSKRLGNALPEMPATREQRRRFLAVREGDQWGVKLDLTRTVARAEFAARFLSLLEKSAFAEAEAMLTAIPEPPDEPNSLKKEDRLEETLKLELEKAKKPR